MKLKNTIQLKEVEMQKVETEKQKNQNNQLRIQELTTQIKSENDKIANLGIEKGNLQNENQKVTRERDILANMLIRKNDELALLKEKLDILNTVLKKGAMQYQQRIEEIRALRTALSEQRQKMTFL